MLSSNESDTVDRLAVTTRRSQHVFRRRPQPRSQDHDTMDEQTWDVVVEQVRERLAANPNSAKQVQEL